MAERTGDRDSPLANMVLRWMAYNQPGLTDKQMDACLAGADALEEVERLRHRNAELERGVAWAEERLNATQVYAAELRDLLQRMWRTFGGDDPPSQLWNPPAWRQTPLGRSVHAALQTDPPSAGQAILDEVQRLREAIRDAIPHVPYRVEQDLRAALHQTPPEEVGDG